jgi:hypothetical protein
VRRKGRLYRVRVDVTVRGGSAIFIIETCVSTVMLDWKESEPRMFGRPGAPKRHSPADETQIQAMGVFAACNSGADTYGVGPAVVVTEIGTDPAAKGEPASSVSPPVAASMRYTEMPPPVFAT